VGFELATGKDLILGIGDFFCAHSLPGVVIVVSSVAGLDGVFVLWEDVVFVDDVVACDFSALSCFWTLACHWGTLRVIHESMININFIIPYEYINQPRILLIDPLRIFFSPFFFLSSYLR